ncbi:hypothetical protein OF83DRAFT_1179795 [Amylostereum chailletii]|nr:hypothetical protein OF83DRAFT_1179795 [Amylostereum chailletii]
MDQYIKEGIFNPRIEPMQNGFNRLFVAWLIQKDKTFTTGEAPSLKFLFKYIRCNFSLPTNTTVCNAVGKILIELHGAIIRELAAVKSKIAYGTDSWTTPGMIFTFAGTLANWIDDN